MIALSQDLTSLLDSDGSLEEVAAQIAAVPALLAEAEAQLPALKAVATAKAGEWGVREVIGRRFELYPQPKRTDAQWAAWWSDYVEALSEASLASLEAAMRAYIADRESEFIPKPGKLRELAFTVPTKSLQRYNRAREAVRIAYEPAPGCGPKLPPEEVRRMVEEFTAATTKPIPVKPELPSTAGKPDAGGITERMRELMARRAEERRS